MTMKIEAGRYYRTRDGQKVGPMYKAKPKSDYRWNVVGATNSRWSDGGMDGNEMAGVEEGPHDLIAEWSAPMNLTAITTPFGLLDRETQEALKAQRPNLEMFSGTEWSPASKDWPLAEALAYRVKPAPPKPREWFLGCSGGYRHVYDTREAAQTYVDHNTDAVLIHVREILPSTPTQGD